MSKKFRNKLVETDPNGDTHYVQEEIVEEEASAPAEQEVQPVVEEHKVDFDGWYGARRNRIPRQHHKEILKADFKARKVPVMATMAEFDEALKKYGVKLA